MKSEPLISIGMPVHNSERFLRGAIESMLDQSHENIELIISDNASTDGTAAICDEYRVRDTRVRYFRQPRNIGAPRNWNFVATHARGEYLKWASSNDYCDTNMLTACVSVLESDRQAVLCHGKTCLVDEGTGELRPYGGDISITDERPSARLACLLAKINLNNAVCGLIRVSALRNTGLIRFYLGGDLVMMAELAIAGTFVLLPQTLLYRRMGAHTFSANLSDEESKSFLGPQGLAGLGPNGLRKSLGYMASALRASISIDEKRRALVLLTRYAYWHFRNVSRSSR